MIVPKGRGRDARWAVEATGPILDLLEKYFDIPYPYEKLDHLVIPQTVGFGAMENPGLVTYVSTSILYKPEDETVAFRRGYASVCAHETAHQWFGDLVTMAWWDDVWLNESFATWMAAKIMTRWQPAWNTALNRVASSSSVMEADTLVTARRIRQPILTSGDIVNAFDGITYQKGSAVLGMFETWLGEEPFRRGVQRYLRTHIFGNATATDFLAAIAAETKNPAVPAAFSTFLDQAGVPLVTAGLECRAGTARLVLSQKRFLPVGSSGSAGQTWQVPVCARAGEPSAAAVCMLLSAEAGELALPGTRCPERVLLNPGSTGYYRTFYKGGLRAKLLADAGSHVTPADRVGILLDMAALAQSGDVSMASALALVPRFAGDADRHVVAATVRIAASAKDGLVPSELRANYGRFLEDTFGERARTLGFRSRPGEDDETKLLRTNLVGLVAENADDRVLGPEAAALARKWLKDRSAVEPEMMGIVLAAAARDGDAELFSAFRAEAMKTSDRRERRALLGALGFFRDPAVALEALRLTLSPDFDARESVAILRSEAGRPETRLLAWSFFQVRYDALVARLPRDYAAGFPGFFSGFSDATRRAEFEVFFKDRAPKAMGGDLRLAQALEAIHLHEALRAAQGESVSEFLAAYPASATLDLRPSTGR
jgi:cytosol alanyl aminopeptidase